MTAKQRRAPSGFGTTPGSPEWTERLMPQQVHAEEAVLGTLLNFPKRIEEVIDFLRPQDFYRNMYRDVYEMCVHYYRKHGYGADFLTLTDMCEQRERAERAGSEIRGSDLVDLLHQHLSSGPWSFDLQQDAHLIVSASFQRQVIAAAQQLATIGYTIADADTARCFFLGFASSSSR